MDEKKRRKLYLDDEDEEVPRTTMYRSRIAKKKLAENKTAVRINSEDDPIVHHDNDEKYVTDDSNDDGSDNDDQDTIHNFPVEVEEHNRVLEDESGSILKNMLLSDETLGIIRTPVVVSVGEILLMLLKYALFNSLTHTAVTNLFKAINCIFATPILPDTRYLIDKLFFSTEFVKYHAICPYCGAYAGTFKHSDRQRSCPTCEKNIVFQDSTFKSFYATFNIKSDIRALLERNEIFYHHIMEERVHVPGIYEDIYDGRAYREFVQSLNSEENRQYVTLTFNCDGASKFKCSTYSVYPVQVMLNELPVDVRISEPIVCALWFGKKKPDMNVFLQGFVEEMNQVSDTGIPCTILGQQRQVKPYAICCCVDSVARAPMQGITQYNGKYGCSWCLHPGERVANIQNTGGSLKFPILNPMPRERNEENLLKCMQYVVNPPVRHKPSNRQLDNTEHASALEVQQQGLIPANINNPSAEANYAASVVEQHEINPPNLVQPTSEEEEEHSFGVQHVSPLNNLKKFNMISGFTPDDMHFARLGIALQFSDYWFDSKVSPLTNTFTAADVREIDKLLENVQVPNQAMRLTRSISERAHWKAKEWENWILYCSLPILELFLDRKLLKHWALFVEAFYLSLKPTITKPELERVETLMKKFVLYTEKYYTKRAMTYNVHQSLHWVRSLADWGPSWAHTAFAFESNNGKILQMIKAAKGVTHQVCRQLSYHQCDLILTNSIFPICSARVKGYCLNLQETHTQKTCKIVSIRYFGVPRKVEQTWIEKLHLSQEAISYQRMVKDRCIYSSAEKKKHRSNNSFAQLKDGSFIQISRFIVDEFSEGQYTICKILTTENAYQNHCPNIQKVKNVENTLQVVNTEDIAKICVFLKIRNVDYICPVPNLYYIS